MFTFSILCIRIQLLQFEATNPKKYIVLLLSEYDFNMIVCDVGSNCNN